MTDLKTALSMEEEAMREMKRNQSLKRSKKGIANPMCSNYGIRQIAEQQKPKLTSDSKPDLMSFTDAAKATTKSDWSTFEQPLDNNVNKEYDSAIKNVMSLFDSQCRSQQNIYPTNVWPSSSTLPAVQQPSTLGRDGGIQYQPNLSYSQTNPHQSSAFTSLHAYPHRSSLTCMGTHPQIHAPLVKNHSHPTNLNLFPSQTVTNPSYFSATNFVQKASLVTHAPVSRNSLRKQLDVLSGSTNERQSPTPSKADLNFDEVFSHPRTLSNQTTTSSSSGDNEQINSIFLDWFDGQLTKADLASNSPKREVAPVIEKSLPNWVDLDPLNTQLENLTSVSQKAPVTMSNWKTDGAQLGRDVFSESTDETDSTKPESSSTALIGQDSELERFCLMLENLRSHFKSSDTLSNPGHIVGNIMSQNQWIGPKGEQTAHEDIETTVKVSVVTEESTQPVTFECYVNSSVEHIVSQALCIAYEDISLVSADDYAFKVVGRQEYMLSKTLLSSYQYVQECYKYERDVELELVHQSKVDVSLKRTSEDDSKPNLRIDFQSVLKKPDNVVTRDSILILWEAFYNETDSLIQTLEKDSSDALSPGVQQQCERVVQSVKAMCSALGNIETMGIMRAVKGLRAAIHRPEHAPAKSPAAVPVLQDLVSLGGEKNKAANESPRKRKSKNSVEDLTQALLDYVEDYCQSHESNFYSDGSHVSKPTRVNTILSTDVKDLYSVGVTSCQRVPKSWEASYEEFYAVCSLWYGGQPVTHKSMQTPPEKPTKSFSTTTAIIWDKWLDFDVAVFDLPLEVYLKVTVYGSNPSDEKSAPKGLSQINIPLFDRDRILKHGVGMFGMWDLKSYNKEIIHHCFDDILNTDSPVVTLSFSEERDPSSVVKFPERKTPADEGNGTPSSRRLSALSSDTQRELNKAMTKAKLVVGSLCDLSEKEKEVLWQNRDIVATKDDDSGPALSLPLLLRCVPSWSPSAFHARDAYKLVSEWPQRPQPEESLALLTSVFPDSHVRSAAIRWLEGSGDMDIQSWLPQLVQALKWEQRLDSPLMRLVLRRSMGSIRIAQKLFWLLHENMADPVAGRRYKALHAALLAVCGAPLKKEFDKEHYFVGKIHRTAEAVRDAKDSNKTSVLQDDLTKVSSRIGGHSFRVPINPAYVANGVNVKNSSHFNSNAVPIKVAITNADQRGGEVNVMYKIGDDLRQDALTMQLIRVMDRMWLAEGLDLRIMTFECLPTGPNQGLVELISDSRTFREIQSSYGLTGAFKDRPIAEWLQKYNPTGISYERAVENFTLSCAGYCVATYVLGICDRHNDNIMLRRTGHLFHIDFARFLGHAQMFGNIKRDRAPFVLTSDMAYVINGGDRPSSQFHDFVDICCRAFNIVRKQSHILINLLSLMLDCGIPELNSKADLKYVYHALRPHASDKEATIMFTRLIDTSLSSSFTRLNFFIHNLAQMRFHGIESEEQRRTLSFAPELRPYKQEDGIIVQATVVGYQKRYCPEKYYLYCVKVLREKTTTRTVESYVFRTFDEFEELHNKLCNACSTSALPSFPSSVVVGRSQVKNVAERRKAKLNTYLGSLLTSKRNVAMHDLVYTFFHPILRDEEKEVRPSLRTPDVIGGEIKISLHYKNSALYIMIIHCKNLSRVNGSDPDPYVKTYLYPDSGRTTKRKTKVARKTLHPTYNEMLIYDLSLNDIKRRQLQVAVWNYETLQENDFLGGVSIDLSQIDVSAESTSWYKLSSSFT